MTIEMRRDLADTYSIPFEALGGDTHYLDYAEVARCEQISVTPAEQDHYDMHGLVIANHPDIGTGLLMSIDLEY